MDRPDVSDNGETGIILWLDDPKRDKGKFGIKNSEFGISVLLRSYLIFDIFYSERTNIK